MPVCLQTYNYYTVRIKGTFLANNKGEFNLKRLKLSAVLIVAALSIAAVGSAALSSVTFNRNVSAGQILVDTDENVAIQITNASTKYPGLVKTGADGKITINLNEAINNNVNSGFNTDALFSIGTPANGVIKIKNNSDIPVTVSMTNDAGNINAISLIPANNSSNIISAGSAADFYFTINTSNQAAAKPLNAVLYIEGK